MVVAICCYYKKFRKNKKTQDNIGLSFKYQWKKICMQSINIMTNFKSLSPAWASESIRA
jgi:hypothetical protein